MVELSGARVVAACLPSKKASDQESPPVKGTLIRRPSVNREYKTLSVPEEPTVLSGLHPTLLWISAP